MNAEIPTTIIGLIGVTVITVGGLIKLRMEQKVQGRKVDEMHEQTVNDHQNKSNMRDDLDKTRDTSIATHDAASEIYNVVRDIQERQMAQGRELGGMRADMTGVRADMTGVRADMTGLRTDITGVNSRLSDEQKRSIEADEQLWRAILNRPADDPPSR